MSDPVPQTTHYIVMTFDHSGYDSFGFVGEAAAYSVVNDLRSAKQEGRTTIEFVHDGGHGSTVSRVTVRKYDT